MDRRDACALFNWGLALCYRGQLVAEEAGDNEEYKALADRMFCAAIDKFEAMLSMTDRWHASALLNWALALRGRSRASPVHELSPLILSQALSSPPPFIAPLAPPLPPALLNWALALRDRSRLRPLSSVSRLRLTQEALQLLRQAAKRDSPLSDGSPRDPTFSEVRNALVLCEAEVAKLKEMVGRGADGGRGSGGRALRPGNESTEIGIFEGFIVVYRFIADLHFYVTGGEDENELILSTVLTAFFEAVSHLLRGNVEKKTVLENLDLVLLCLDELVDGG
ncbi:unnamed protein product [Closterium sp. NIES-64]|nr:unnamed protein product [Closterium sp. NIES-64]